jgi:hypothetical protein
VTHGEPLSRRPTGPTGTGPQERKTDLLPPDLPPGAVHYEATDVTVRPIFKSLGVLVFGTVLVVALLYPLFVRFRSSLARGDAAPPPMGRHEAGRLPAEPRLQTKPVADLSAIRVEDERLLSGYAWVDESRGVVRIPIEVAMRMVAARGLPAAAPTPAASPGAAASPAPGATPAPAAAATPGGTPR